MNFFQSFIFLMMILCCSSSYVLGAGLYDQKSNVIELNADNFAREVFGSPHVWLVEFYAPWCGHCKRLTPEWEAAATKLKGLVKIAAVNCDDEKNKPLAGYFGIQGFPTIKSFGHRMEQSPDGKGVIKKPQDYNGARESAAIIAHALTLLPSEFVLPIKDDAALLAFESQHAAQPAIMLFTDKATTTSLAKALSVDFSARLPFLQIASAAKEAVARFNVGKLPAVVVKREDGSFETYSGKLEHKDLHAWLDKLAPAAQRKPEQAGKEEKEKEKEAPQEPFQVWQVSGQEVLEQKCLQKKGLCVVAFLDVLEEDSFGQYIEVFEALGQANQKKFHFLWLDGPSNYEFGESFSVNSYPGLAVLSPAKKSFVNYPGAFEQQRLQEFLDAVLMGKKRSVVLDQIPSLTSSKLKDEL